MTAPAGTVRDRNRLRLATPRWSARGRWHRTFATEPVPCLPNHSDGGERIGAHYFAYEVLAVFVGPSAGCGALNGVITTGSR